MICKPFTLLDLKAVLLQQAVKVNEIRIAALDRALPVEDLNPVRVAANVNVARLDLKRGVTESLCKFAT
jgi:hypothetical protein